MNMRFILALVLMMAVTGTGCRSPRLFGWRGANCGWQPRGLLRRREPAFAPPACTPDCGPAVTSGYPGEVPVGYSEGFDGAVMDVMPGEEGPIAGDPSAAYVAPVTSGPLVATAFPPSDEVAMGPEFEGVPRSP